MRKNSLTYHANQLLGYSILKVKDIADFLEAHQPTERDIRVRNPGTIASARYLAARAILLAGEGNSAMLQQVWDRRDGKVADRLELVDLNKLVEQLEASRQRVISATSEPQPVVVEGEIVEPEDAQPEPISTESATSK